MDDHPSLLYWPKQTRHGEELNACSFTPSPPGPTLDLCLRRQGPTQEKKKPNHCLVRLCFPQCLLMPLRALTTLQASRRSTTALPSSSAAFSGAACSSSPWPSAYGRPSRAPAPCAWPRCPRSNSRFSGLRNRARRASPGLSPARRYWPRPEPCPSPRCRRRRRREAHRSRGRRRWP